MAYFSIDGKDWESYRKSVIDREDYGRGQQYYNPNDRPFAADLYDYSFGQVRDAVNSLGIRNVNRLDDIPKIFFPHKKLTCGYRNNSCGY